jgi:hypothetical protein
MFSKSDIRVEVNYPGQTLAYALDQSNRRNSVDWMNCYLCSQLRAYRMEPCFVARIITKEPSRDQITTYLSIIKIFHDKKIQFARSDVYDKLKYGPNLLLHEITRFFIKIKRQAILIDFFD